MCYICLLLVKSESTKSCCAGNIGAGSYTSYFSFLLSFYLFFLFNSHQDCLLCQYLRILYKHGQCIFQIIYYHHFVLVHSFPISAWGSLQGSIYWVTGHHKVFSSSGARFQPTNFLNAIPLILFFSLSLPL